MMVAKSRLLEIDCLRGIAAISVVIFHFTLGTKNILRFGCCGVELFFIISGFVIFLTIEKTRDYKTFLQSRFARLYPAYWTGVCLTTLVMIVWTRMVNLPLKFPSLIEFAANLTMFQYFFRIKDIDGPYWTLTYELLFYLFMVVVYLLKKTHKIELISWLMLIISLINGTFLRLVYPNIYITLAGCFPLLIYFPLFIAGIIFYKIKFYQINLNRGILLALSLSIQIMLFDCTNKSASMNQTEYTVMLTVFYAIFMLYCFNYLKFIINPVLLFLGKISYSLYLFHDYISYSILIPFFSHSRHIHIGHWWLVDFFIVLPIILLMATLINRFIEVPAMVYLKQHRKQVGDAC